MSNNNNNNSWSPLDCLPVAKLTRSGLLELDGIDGEVELMRRDEIELRCDSAEPLAPLSAHTGGIASTSGKTWIDRDKDLKVSVTTHRIVFLKEEGGGVVKARFLPLSNVHQIEKTTSRPAGLFFSSSVSPKISIHSYLGDLLLVFRSMTTSVNTASKDRDDMMGFLQKALDRRAWETANRLKEKKRTATSETVAARKVGVDAILTKNALKHKEAARLTTQAFEGDAETLLKEAAELVGVIRKYVVTLERNQQSNNDDDDDEDARRLADMLQNMGMASALSKDKYRVDDYYQTLARQMADFLRPKLPKAGGLMTLTDVYCLFNRARGTNLVSPEDLLQATRCMKGLKLGMSERTFSSGLKVVQDDSFNDAVMAQKLLGLMNNNDNNNDFVTSLEASRALHVSALLANEQLLASEQAGYLCRDDTLETTRFYPNKFKDFRW